MNPWVILAVVFVWFASLLGVGRWQNTVGHTQEKTYWLSKETKELEQANAKIIDLTKEAREREQAMAGVLAAVTTHYEGKLDENKKRRDADVSAAYSGSLRLRYRPDTPSACPGGSGPSKTPTTPGGRDGTETAELPGAIAADLLTLANDADAVVEQLSACQAVVNADRGM